MEQGTQVKIVLILRFPTLAQLLTKSRDSVKSPKSPVHCTGSHLCSCAASGLQPVLAGEVPLLIPLLNLPSVQTSLHFVQTLKTETYEEKDSHEGWKTNLTSNYSCAEHCWGHQGT